MDPRHPQTAARILGLTGPIGCGKTTVGDILLELGAHARIDADRVVHSLLTPGAPVTRQVADVFGSDVLAADGAVDRTRLGEIVFADAAQLTRLEQIVHPEVRAAAARRLDEFGQQDGVIVIDAVKLLQSDLLQLTETVWLVCCTPSVQHHRLTKIRGMSEQAAAGRLAAQPSYAHESVALVLDNSGSLEDLRHSVTQAWNDFLRRPAAD